MYKDIQSAEEYRKPKLVKKMVCFKNMETGWQLCPTCNQFLDREYIRFCPYCGQRLKWNLSKLKIIEK